MLDDGETPTRATMGQTVVRRRPGGSLPAQLRAAWLGGFVTGSIVLFIEDDDYYPPCHVERCVERIESGIDLWGENPYRVYHVAARKAGVFEVPLTASALARTAVRRDVLAALPTHAWLSDCISFDIRLWKMAQGRKLVETLPGRQCVVGIKGMPGRKGLTPGHDPNLDEYAGDPDGETLRRWMGDDAEFYLPFGRSK